MLTQRKRSACLIPRTPALDDAGKEDLLRVVSNVGTHGEDDFAEVAVAARNDFRFLHSRMERPKNMR